jgi:myo-inositol-1(or 4)-monophosphatase
VSIGAVINNDVKVGVIYLPMMNELYVAEKGQGAFLNGVKLSVSKVKVFQNAVASMGFPYVIDQKAVRSAELFLEISRKGNPIRDLGSAAVNLAYLAAGRLDAFWNASLQPWDLAAGKLLVEEAGGTVTQYDNSPLKLNEACSVVGTNKFLHEELLAFLKKSGE